MPTSAVLDDQRSGSASPPSAGAFSSVGTGGQLSPAQAAITPPHKHAAHGGSSKNPAHAKHLSPPNPIPSPQQWPENAQPRHRGHQSSSPAVLSAKTEHDSQRAKQRRTASEGAAPGGASLLSPVKRTASSSPRGGVERETKGTWMPAAIFIFLSHVVVAVYALLWLRHWVSGAAAPTAAPSWSLVFCTWFSAWLNLLGITAGYHRLWSHNSYQAAAPLKIFLAIIGLMSFQGSARWWALKHRLHHRFTDTENDPYDSTKGLWFSHIGWLFEPPPVFSKMPLIKTKDLDEDWVVCFQKRWLLWGYLFFGFFLLGFIGLALPDRSFWMGALWIGVVGRFVSWHCIWLINSFSHWEGYKEFSKASSAVYVAVLNFLQNGEGHHNRHHAFPSDFAHGARWYEFDPTKWFILACVGLGLAWDLQRTDENEVKQSQAQVLQQEADEARAKAKWGPTDAELPRMTAEEFQQLATKTKGSKILLSYQSYVLDATSYAPKHPGGRTYLASYHGRTIDEAFEGGTNLHTQAAANQAAMLRIARIR